MNLEAIQKHLKNRKYKNELSFMCTVWNFCHRYKIDYCEFSTVGWEYFGNQICTFDKDGCFETKLFRVKKVTQEQADEQLTKFIKAKHLEGKKDLIVFYKSFFGLKKIVFYDAETNSSFVITGTANEQQKNFLDLVELYHKI